MKNYKKFYYEYKKSYLLDYYDQKFQKKYFRSNDMFVHIDHTFLIGDYTPLFEIIDNKPDHSNFGLSKIYKETGLHCTPRNNGLLILPVEGTLTFDFYSYISNEGRPKLMPTDIDENKKQQIINTFEEKIIIDQPTAINGLTVHNYYPTNTEAIFYAVKIPATKSFNEVISKL